MKEYADFAFIMKFDSAFVENFNSQFAMIFSSTLIKIFSDIETDLIKFCSDLQKNSLDHTEINGLRRFEYLVYQNIC